MQVWKQNEFLHKILWDVYFENSRLYPEKRESVCVCVCEPQGLFSLSFEIVPLTVLVTSDLASLASFEEFIELHHKPWGSAHLPSCEFTSMLPLFSPAKYILILKKIIFSFLQFLKLYNFVSPFPPSSPHTYPRFWELSLGLMLARQALYQLSISPPLHVYFSM